MRQEHRATTGLLPSVGDCGLWLHNRAKMYPCHLSFSHTTSCSIRVLPVCVVQVFFPNSRMVADSNVGSKMFSYCMETSKISASHHIVSRENNSDAWNKLIRVIPAKFRHNFILLLWSGSPPSCLSHVTFIDEEISIAICQYEHYVYELSGFLWFFPLACTRSSYLWHWRNAVLLFFMRLW